MKKRDDIEMEVNGRELFGNRNARINSYLMPNILIGLFIAILLVFLAQAAYTDTGALTQDVNECGILNTTDAVYTLTADVVSNSTCFNITANNITLDGNGHRIDYSLNGTLGYGVFVGRYNLTTIKNFTIKEGVQNALGKHGIYLSYSEDSTIQDNTIMFNGSGSYGVFLHYAKRNNVTGNLINGTVLSGSYSVEGIDLSSAVNNTISNNIIITTLGIGISLTFTSIYNTLENNTISLPSTGTYNGISSTSSSNSNIMRGNNINISGNGPANGIYLSSASNDIISNNNITTWGNYAYGIYLSSATNETLTGNYVNSSKHFDYYLTGTSAAHFNHSIDSSNLAKGKPLNYTKSTANVVFDGYDDTTSTPSYGQIILFDSPNAIIQNSNFSLNGITLLLSNNATINQNIIKTNSSAVYLSMSSNATVKNNQITTYQYYGHGINLAGSLNNNLINNTINTAGTNGYGFWLESTSDSNTISNNTIKTTGTSNPIYLTSSSNNNISNNIVNSSAAGYAAHSIYLVTSSNNSILNNAIFCKGTTAAGIDLYTSSNSNNIVGNNITSYTASGYGIWLWTNSNSNIFSNNTIVTKGTTSPGINLWTNTNNNTFSGMDIKTISNYAVNLFDTQHNFSISDSIINSSGGQDFYIESTSTGGIWNFTNVTRADGSLINVTWTAGGKGTLNMMNWANTYVNSTNGSALSGANVSAFNVNGVLQFSFLTGADGYTGRQALTYYVRNNTSGATTTYYTNHTFNASYSIAPVQTQSLNMSTNRNVVFSFDSVAPTASILTNFSNATNINTGNLNFTVNLTDGVSLKNATLSVAGNETSNYYLNFDGVNDKVNAYNVGSFGYNNGNANVKTITFWAKGSGYAFSNSRDANSFGYGILYIYANGSMNYNLGSAANSYYGYNLYSNAAADITGWNFYSFSVSIPSGTGAGLVLDANISINGVFENYSLTYASTDMIAFDNISIGHWHNYAYNNWWFNGSMDEVRVYNRTLSQAEITQLYNQNRKSDSSLLTSSLVAYYDFNEGSGTTLIDRATGINNGTITGAVYASSYSSSTNTNFVEGTISTVI